MTIFEKIANKDIPAFIVWENTSYMAFLSIEPQCPGHTVVAPKYNPGDQVFELNDEEYANLMTATKEVAQLLKSKLEVDRVLMIVEGFEVPHVHTKLYPVNIGWSFHEHAPKEASQQELQNIFNKLTHTG